MLHCGHSRDGAGHGQLRRRLRQCRKTGPESRTPKHVDAFSEPSRRARPPDAARPSRAPRPHPGDRSGARGRAFRRARPRAGAARHRGDGRARPSGRLREGDRGGGAARRHDRDRRRHDHVAGHLGGGAARHRRRRAGRRRGDDGEGQERLLGDAPARPSRRAHPRHGVLLLQQCRDRRPARAKGAWRRARRDRRLGRPSRQRLAGHLLERRLGDVLLDPPDAALSRHRRRLRARRPRHHRQCAAAARRRRRRLPRGVRDRDPAAARELRARPHRHLGRVRRALARSAREPQPHRGGFRLGDAEADGARRHALRAAASSRCWRAATTSTGCRNPSRRMYRR